MFDEDDDDSNHRGNELTDYAKRKVCTVANRHHHPQILRIKKYKVIPPPRTRDITSAFVSLNNDFRF
jgi:hypothetical protein